MAKFVQEFVTQFKLIRTKSMALFCKLQSCFSSIKLYVHPTPNQRFGFVIPFYPEFVYQRVASGFDNFSIRAIIRDEDFLNGH